uniref:hypothetical protein n=1 Tax=Clostridium sp. 12(A) TaxID=1163671 RepID=UPI0004667886|nr:hypothetical protein [Clostridium sp. 12(A)]
MLQELKIGKCIVNSDGDIIELEREFYGQGMIFKDEHAFRYEEKIPCYVPELSDTVYTREDFLRMCNNQEDIANVLFESVDWQHPETYLDEQFKEEEMNICKTCGKIFLSSEVENCPYCGILVAEEIS